MASTMIDAYLTTISNQNVRTAKVYRSHLLDFDRYNNTKTDDVIKGLKDGTLDYFAVLNGYTSYLTTKGTLAGRTVGFAVKCARRLLAYYDIEVTDSKFRLKIKLPKATKRRPTGLEKTDIIKIINECKEPRLKVYCHFLAASGCRAEEALSIRLGDIDFEKKSLHLKGDFTKTKEDRTIRLTSEIVKELNSWLSYKYRTRVIKSRKGDQWIEREIMPAKDDGDFVFIPYNEEDRSLTNVAAIRHMLKNAYYPLYDQFRAMANRIGYNKVSFHSFRRFAYSTVESIINKDYADFYLGHAYSPYWDKSEKELNTIFEKVEPYLTFTDVLSLEAKSNDNQTRLDQMQEELQKIRAERKQLLEQLYKAGVIKKE